MPHEIIGACGGCESIDSNDERSWAGCEILLGITYLTQVCGEPPEGFELQAYWQSHELGPYVDVALVWEHEGAAVPWWYINNCERVLRAFNNAVAWGDIHPSEVKELVTDTPRQAERDHTDIDDEHE